MDESGKACKVNVQDVKPLYPVNELINCLPDITAFGCATKYVAHPKLMKDFHWKLNPPRLPDM